MPEPFSGLMRISDVPLRNAFDVGPTSNSIAAVLRFIVAREIIHLPPIAFPSRENDYVRTIFISYPAQHHRSRDKHGENVG